MFRSEFDVSSSSLVARMLVLVEMTRPCHKGGFSIHALPKHGRNQRYMHLWGFDGFNLESLGDSGSHRAASTAQATPRSQGPPLPSKEDQWQKFVQEDLGYNLDAPPKWMKFAPALKELERSSKHGKRYLDPCSDGSAEKCWTRADGRWPVEGVDWQHMAGKGTKGGGNAGSGGPIFVRKAFLKSVYLRKYARTK